MKKLHATIVAMAVLALVLGSVSAGCGGGGGEEAASPAGGAAGQSSSGASGGGTSGGGTPGAAVTATATVPNKDEITQNVQFVPTAETPASFTDALKKKKPICVEFYRPGDPVTADVSREMKVVKKDFGKQFVFLSYDVDNPSKTAAISAQLNAGYEPYIILLDKNHFIVYKHSGYIDRFTLEQQMFSTLRR